MPNVIDEIDGRRLHHELELRIKSVNRDLISEATGTIDRNAFDDVTRMVACLRARYLHTVLALARESPNECIDTESALKLKKLRVAYNEALAGFEALEHALTRGYISLAP